MKNNRGELAKKFNINVKDGGYDAGCPGIMSPNGETPVINLEWFWSWANADKTHRAQQFDQVLSLLHHFEYYKSEIIKQKYLDLSIFGKVMIFKIANNLSDNNLKYKVLSTIEPYAKENLQDNPFYEKSDVSASNIFEHYVSPIINQFKEEFSNNNNNNNNQITLVEDKNDEESKKLELVEKEKSLVSQIVSGTIHKSGDIGKIKPVINQINELNQEKYKLGMIDEYSEIKLSQSDVGSGIINTDILYFCISGGFVDQLTAAIGLAQVFDLCSEGSKLAGSKCSEIKNLLKVYQYNAELVDNIAEVPTQIVDEIVSNNNNNILDTESKNTKGEFSNEIEEIKTQEQSLLNDIISSKSYKLSDHVKLNESGDLNNLNQMIEKINVLNTLKYNMGINKAFDQIPEVSNTRSNETIDSDVVQFVLDSEIVDNKTKELFKHDIASLVLGKGYGLSGSKVDDVDDIIDDLQTDVQTKEKNLVDDIVSSKVYTSSNSVELNNIISQINELNQEKCQLGMIDEYSEIALLENNRVHKSIDTNIVKFVISSQYGLDSKKDLCEHINNLSANSDNLSEGYNLYGTESIIEFLQEEYQNNILGESKEFDN